MSDYEGKVIVGLPELDAVIAKVDALEERVAALEQPATPPAPSKPSPPTVPPDFTDRNLFRLVFQDDFDHEDSTPDPSLWSFDYLDGHRNLPENGERQLYMDPSWRGSDGKLATPINPFSIADSILTICADHMPAAALASTYNYWYLSGMIRSAFAQQYGRFVCRMKLPAGSGLWPAFWLLPTDGTWPPELDAIEFFGDNGRGEGGPTRYHAGLITNDEAHKWSAWVEAGVDLTQDFHVYALDWDADQLVYYLDGKETARAATPPEAHKPMYVIVDFAVGGKWPGDPPTTTKFPAVLAVDFVRAFSRR